MRVMRLIVISICAASATAGNALAAQNAPPPDGDLIVLGMIGFLYLEGSHEPIGTALTRHAVKFWNKLQTG